MKRTMYTWLYDDCLYRIEVWRNAPKDVCPYTVYMLSSNKGKGPGKFVGYFMTKEKAENAIKKSSAQIIKPKMKGSILLP